MNNNEDRAVRKVIIDPGHGGTDAGATGNNLLEKEKKLEFIELIENSTKEDIVLTFLSILEMSKDNLITLSQEKNFSKI